MNQQLPKNFTLKWTLCSMMQNCFCYCCTGVNQSSPMTWRKIEIILEKEKTIEKLNWKYIRLGEKEKQASSEKYWVLSFHDSCTKASLENNSLVLKLHDIYNQNFQLEWFKIVLEAMKYDNSEERISDVLARNFIETPF